jgi:hypothetical protein
MGVGMKSRVLWGLVLGAFALVGVLSACAGWRDEAAAPMLRAPTAEEAAQASCYQQSLYDGSWERAYSRREAQCFRDDSCFGGLGQTSSDGRPLCFKWAVAPDAPALRWSRTLTHPQPGVDIPPDEAVYDGGPEGTNEEPPPMRMAADTPIYVERDVSSRLVGVIAAHECVQPDGVSIRSAPRRGVVLETTDAFTAGDVIYELAYQGEGYTSVWRRGEFSEISWDDVVVRWDAPPESDDPRLGLWTHYVRSDGSSGWSRDGQGRGGCEE